MERLSRAQWANEVERGYALTTWWSPETWAMRMTKRALLSWPLYCVGVVLHAVDTARKGS